MAQSKKEFIEHLKIHIPDDCTICQSELVKIMDAIKLHKRVYINLRPIEGTDVRHIEFDKAVKE